MINEQTCETLRKMKLNAMADELTHQLEDQTSYGTLGFEERLGINGGCRMESPAIKQICPLY